MKVCPGAGARVTTCVTIAPARFPTCRSQLTGTAGRVTVSARVTGHATITARFAGSSATSGAMARPVLVTALPRTTLLAGRGTLTFGVSPVRAGCRLGVLRQVGTAWRTVRTVRLPASGQLVVRALPHGTYRIAVPATDRTAAAVTSARTI